MELEWLHNWILVLATFIRYSHRVHDNEEYKRQVRHKPGMGVILPCPATWVYLMLEDGQQGYFRGHQIALGNSMWAQSKRRI